jgi:hypothetical protein
MYNFPGGFGPTMYNFPGELCTTSPATMYKFDLMYIVVPLRPY